MYIVHCTQKINIIEEAAVFINVIFSCVYGTSEHIRVRPPPPPTYSLPLFVLHILKDTFCHLCFCLYSSREGCSLHGAVQSLLSAVGCCMRKIVAHFCKWQLRVKRSCTHNEQASQQQEIRQHGLVATMCWSVARQEEQSRSSGRSCLGKPAAIAFSLADAWESHCDWRKYYWEREGEERICHSAR